MKSVEQYRVQEMSLEEMIKTEGGFRFRDLNHIYFLDIPTIETRFILEKPQLFSKQI